MFFSGIRLKNIKEKVMTRNNRSSVFVLFTAVFLALAVAAPAVATLPPGADLVGMSYSKENGLAVLSHYELFITMDGIQYVPSGLMDRAEALSAVVVGKRVVLVAAESGVIYRSLDGGPFIEVPAPRDPYGRTVKSISRMAIHSRDEEILASSGQGVIRSRDLGATWEPIETPFYSNPDAREVIAVAYVKDKPVIVTKKGPYRETRKGFEPITKGLPGSVTPTVASVFDGEILMALPGEGIYLAQKDSAFKKLKEAPGDPIAFVGFTGDGYLAARPTTALHKGDSKGKTWTPVGVGYSPSFVPRDSLSTPFGDYLILRRKGLVRIEGDQFTGVELPVGLSSTNAVLTAGGAVLAGTQGGIYRSTSAGKSWVDVTPPDLGVSVSTFLQVADGRIFAGAEGAGVFISSDNGATWTRWNRGLGTANTVRGMVQFDGGLLAGTENGLMWTPLSAEPAWSYRDAGVGRNSVNTLIAEEGQYWLCNQNGVLTARDKGDFTPVPGFEGPAASAAAAGGKLAAVVAGTVVVAEKGGNAVKLPRLPVRAVITSVAFRGKSVIAGSSQGVFSWDGTAWKRADERNYPVGRLVSTSGGTTVVTGGAGSYDLP